MWELEIPEGSIPLGYKALIDFLKIKGAPQHHRLSYRTPKWKKREIKFDNQNLTIHFYPPSFHIELEDSFHHLEFALKHEGVNLFILKKIFHQLSVDSLVEYIQKQPTGKYARMIWFLYENLLEKTLTALTDLQQGSYIPILDPEKYYTGAATKSTRHRIENNLLGGFDFCPVVRKTEILKAFEAKKLNEVAKELTQKYELEIITRAMRYLYTKETLASWEIEREKPSQAKLTRFTSLLMRADTLGPISKQMLVELQKEIVDPRFALSDYRDFQNYIGAEPGPGQLILHYICPRPQDVPRLMQGLIESFEKIHASCNPVVTAAVLSFGFVFIHPFWDGNGRLHRFLIHYALSRLEFTPKEVVFPISATIVREPLGYDRALESFSKPLMDLITKYQMNDAGEMTVSQDTLDLYRFIDFTPLAEYLFTCVEKTIKTDFKQELQFLVDYDKIKNGIKELIDMPDQHIDLIIKCIRQNGGNLSARKRKDHFSMLTDHEIEQIQIIVTQSGNL